MSIRRFIAYTLTVALVALGLIAVPSASPVSAADETAQLPSDNPANFTPNVLNGEVDSIWQVGNTVIIGGNFTQVADSEQNGGTVYNRTYLAAFNATTGVIDPNFAPVLSSYVTTVIPSADPGSVYIGGDFNTVNGTNRRKVARISLSNGALVTGFNANGVNGVVKDLRLVGNDLYIAGTFTAVGLGNQPRTRLASLNATTGAVTTKLNVAIAGMQNNGTTSVYKIDVTPAGDRMLIIGNFRTVNALDRRQIALLDISTDPATVSPWQTNFYTSTCSGSFESYMRDVDIAEDGTFAVVTTTGAYVANSSCDTDARLQIDNPVAGITPNWVTYTGGDTSYAVEVHNGVAYIGGHMRWGNNPSAADAAGQGAVPREGMMALDVATGLPFSWDPGRERGVGLFDFHVTAAGLWAGSDTDRWNDEMRQKLAFFPWANGSLVPANEIGTLPNNVFLLGRTTGTTGTDPSVLYRINAGGPALTSADDGPDWAVDTASTSSFRNTGSSTASYSLTVGTVDSTVPNGDFDRPPAAIYNTERYDPAGGNEMQWNFNVTAGTPIQVRLYMGNKANGTNDLGERVFDIDLDGVNVVDNIDLSGSVGHNVGTMRSFNINSDGQVNILFRHGVENPMINAIEIVRTDISHNGTVGQQDEVQRRSYDGVNAPGPNTVLAGTAPWRNVRGSFMVNNTLYTMHSDGTMLRRTFDGSTFGPGIATFTYANGIISELNTMTGIFFEPSTSRIYYTLSGQSSLFYRSFLPESHIIGATRWTATGAVASLNPTRVRGMFLANGQIWFGDNTAGNLLKIGFANGVVTGTAAVANATTDWRARAMFLVNVAQPNVPPTANFTSLCAVNSCDFDASTSTDTDGTITGYAWDFGDGQFGTGITTSHAYAAAGTYTVILTVTDSDGGIGVTQANVTVTDPPNVAPTASFTSSCTFLSCTFTSTSTDSDGTLEAFAWDFGDGQVGTGEIATHGYSARGTYTVGLTVTDDDAAPASTSALVTVVESADVAVFRASASSVGGATLASVVVPAAVQPGDQLVLIVTANAATTLTTPAGWTLLGTQSDGTPDMRSWVFTRTAIVGTAGSTVSATLGASGKSTTTLMAYSNAQVVTALGSSVIGASSTALTTPAVAVAPVGSAVINYWSDKSAANTGWILPGSVTSRSTAVGTGTGRITSAAADVTVIAANWPGATANSTVAGTKGIGWSIVISAIPPNVPPTASFTSSCPSLSCSFTSTSTDGDGTITGYAWDFGDGQFGSGPTPSHTYAIDGTYTVSLIVTDDDNDTGSTSGPVSVVDPPNVAPTASFTSDCTLLSCTFTSTSTDSDGTLVDFAWDFGDGQIGSGAVATHDYAVLGTYTVGLTVTDNESGVGSTSAPVTVLDANVVFRASASSVGGATVSAVVVPASVQPGDQLVLVVTANAATTLTTPAGWTLLGTQSDGTPDMRSWVFTRVAIAGTAGSTVTATLGVASKSATVLMAYSNADAPTVLASSVIGASSAALATPTVAVTTPGSAVINYWSDKSSGNTGWTLPGSVTSRSTAIGTGTSRITAAAADVIVTDPNWPGATATSTIAGTKGIGWSIVVPGVGPPAPNVPPSASFTSSCPALTCAFTSTSTDIDGTITGFAWDFGDGQFGTGPNPSHTYALDGTYTVTLTVTDDDTDTDSASNDVSVAAPVAAVVFRAASSANSTATNASIVVPGAVQTGDQLVLFVTANVATTITTPSGWTLLDTQSDGTPDMRSWVFTRTAVAGTAGSTVTPVLGASGKVARLLVAYSGADAVSLAASSVMGASSTALTSPAIAVAESNSIVLSHWADKTAGNTGWTLPAEVTQRASSLGTSSGQITAAVGDSVTTVGTWPGATANSSIAGQKGIAWSVVVTPI